MSNISSTVSNSLIAGTDESDSIYSSGDSVTIASGGGADSIDNHGSNVSIDGGADNDHLRNWKWENKYVTVRGGDGNDTIQNVGSYSTLDGGAGNDSVKNFAGNVTITGGDDDDTLFSYGGYSSKIDGGTGNDRILNGWITDSSVYGTNATLIGGEGNDSFANWSDLVTIDAGSGDDTINNNGGDNVSISGGTGNDLISLSSNAENNVIVFSTNDGNDTVIGFNDTDTLKIGEDGKGVYSTQTSGDDIVVTVEDNKDDNDKITLRGAATLEAVNIEGILANVVVNFNSNTTVRGTSDTLKPDAIYNHGHNVTIQALGGSDTILNYGVAPSVTGSSYGSNVSINAGNGNDSIRNNGRYSVLNGGDGKDSITNTSWGIKSTILGGAGDDYIHNEGSSVSIDTGTGNDTILSWRNDSILMNAGSGNDSISSWGNDSTLIGGEGDDKITNHTNGYVDGKLVLEGVGKNVSIAGGAGNDSIDNRGSNVTITGGKGDDFVVNTGANVMFLYNADDGNDLIQGFKANSTLQIGDGTDTCSTTKSDDNKDVIITVGDDSITLNGAASLEAVNIIAKITNPIDNTVSNTVVTGTAYDDTITNSGSDVTINALAGNDSISLDAGAKNNLLVYTQGDGSDTVSGFKANDTVSIVGSSKYSKDSIDNDFIISMVGGGEIVLKDAASLSSVVNIKGGKLSLRGGMEITNNSTDNLVNGTDANDKLINHAGGATILAGNGNDFIDNSTDAKYMLEEGLGYVTIDAGAGNDTILSYDPNVSISGGANADLISLKSSNFSGVTVNAGTGNDTIYGNTNDYGVLYEYRAGDGFDTIYYFGSNDTLSIEGDANYTSDIDGNNVVVSVEGGGQITLIDAAGKDIYIYPTGNAKGKYLINSNDNSLLSSSSYADTIKNYGDNVTINAGNGNDTIYNNKGDRTLINAGNGNDSIDGNNDYVTISAGKGKDTITGNHWRSKLSGDGDNDLISITKYWYNTLDGGDGADTIIAGGSEHSVNGGANADFISLSGDKLTVAGGTGDDTIYGNTATSHLYEYAKGDGNDIIYNYSSNDSITISSANWSTTESDEDILVNVEDSGTISLVGAKGKTLNIYPNTTPTVASGVTAQDVIKKFMGSLDTTASAGKAALDQAVSIASGGYFANVGAAIQQMTLDCAAAGNATTFLKDYCGIDLDNDDTGAISGYDAGGSSVKTAQSIVPEEGDLDSFTGNTFTTNGLTVQLANFNDKNPYGISYSSLKNETEEYIWQAFKTWWADGALDLIAESYGDNFGFGANSSATVKDMYFSFVNDNNNTLATTWNWFYIDSNNNPIDGKAIQLAMTVNMKYYGATTIGNADGKSSVTSALLDRTLAHEMTHAVMAANIDYFNNLPQFIKEGMAELTHGIDDQRGNVIEYLAKDATALNNSLSLLNIGTGTANAYAGGYMFLRYFAKQAAEHYPTSSNAGNLVGNGSVSYNSSDNRDDIVLDGTKLTVSKDFTDDAIDLTNFVSIKIVDATALAKGIEITGNISKNSIKTGVGNDTVFANVGNDTLRGGAGDDILYGEAGNDKLYGDAGDDTLCGGSGNDTLTGGDGKDLFVHVADNDIITDYKDEDKIQLVEGNILSSSINISNSNRVLDVGRHGLITVTGGASKNITVIDGDGNETTFSPVKIKKYTNSSAAKVTLPSTYDVADASARTSAIRIVGNALDNTILGGSKNDTLYGKDGNDYLSGGASSDKLYGQNGADTLWGGTGNDTLTGGAGNDLFIYSTGNDVIADYSAGDKISLGAAISKTSISGSDATFTIGSYTLKVKNGKGKEISFINADGTERTIIGGAYLADDNTKSPVTLATWREVGDATARTIGIKITGNALDNSILGGTGKDSLYGKDGNDYLSGGASSDKLYGQNGADTLWGGTGNDTLIGGTGSDVFIYNNGEGKDVITDFIAKDDMLQITGDFSATYYKSSNKISFKVGSTASAITLKDINVTSATTFNINGDTYKISGTKLVKK